MINQSLAKSSVSLYKRAWNLFQLCIQETKEISIEFDHFPLSSQEIMYFISYLDLTGYAATSITSYTSALGFLHKAMGLKDPTQNFIVQKMLSGINKVNGRLDSRLPITIMILHRLVESLPKTIDVLYHRILLRAMFLMAFFGLFRIGELTIQTDGSISLFLECINLVNNQIVLMISNFKHNADRRPVKILINSQTISSLCPVRALSEYLKIRGLKKGPLFCFSDGKPIPRTFFTSRLKFCLNFCGLDTKLYQSHSFRIGCASFLSSKGFSDDQIQKLGRWKNNSFVAYVRSQQYKLKLK